MPYSIGERGTHGCSGYPVVKTSTGEVMGCHPTAGDAGKQLAALHINEPNMGKGADTVAVNPSSTKDPSIPGVGIKYPTSLTAARRSKGVIRKPKRAKTQTDSSSSTSSSSGSVSSGGAGGSLG